jgi:hypothetical protein
MSQVHQSSALQTLSATPRRLHLRGPLQLQARQAGWLWVDDGQVWITRTGGGADHVLAAGECLFVGRGERVLSEPWRVGETACLRWAQAAPAQSPASVLTGQAAGLRRGARDAVLRAAAAGLRALAGRLALAARRAEASARRAQGAISAGDSMASAGALHQNVSTT